MYTNFFVEYEFRTKNGNIYWFPLFINVSEKKHAEEIAENVRLALSDEFIVLKSTKPARIIDKVNAGLYKEYVKQKLKGNLEILNLHYWKLKKYKAEKPLSFNEYLQIIEAEPDKYFDKVFAEMDGFLKLPVKTIKKDINDHTEYLIINVIKPQKDKIKVLFSMHKDKKNFIVRNDKNLKYTKHCFNEIVVRKKEC